jgi:hypothetical protein
MEKQVYLSKLTGRFRIALEETYQHERPEVRKQDHRWFEIIPCRGFKKSPQEGPYISLHSESPPLLVLYTNKPKNAVQFGRKLKAIQGQRLTLASRVRQKYSSRQHC